MDVIIGRESGAAAPRLCIKMGDKSFFLGTPGSVPKSVSRKHCRLQVDGDKMTISNVSDQNSLFVNGLEYKTKTITKTDLVELGSEHYQLDITNIISLLNKSTPKPEAAYSPKTYHISHLKTVWENYSQNKMDIQIRQGRFNALSAIPGVLSMGSMALFLFSQDGALRTVFLIIAAILALSFAIVRMKNAKGIPLKQKELEERFQDDYVCPNCKHFLGNQNYKLVLKNGGCPWCKSKFTE